MQDDWLTLRVIVALHRWPVDLCNKSVYSSNGRIRQLGIELQIFELSNATFMQMEAIRMGHESEQELFRTFKLQFVSNLLFRGGLTQIYLLASLVPGWYYYQHHHHP